MAFASLAIYASPTCATWLEFDRSILAAGQLWRIITCHLTHFSTSHLFWSGSAFVLLGCVCESRDRSRFIACLALSSIAIPLAILILLPNIRIYRGLSGVDSALFILAAFVFLRDARGPSSIARGLIRLSVLLFCGKILLEWLTMRSIFVQSDPSFVPVPLAHLAGAAIGALAGALHGLSPRNFKSFSISEMT